MKVKRISKNLISYRDKIIYDIWENYKSELSMTDIALIFHTDNSIIFRILKHQKVKNLISK